MVSFNGPCLFVERKPSPCGKCAYSNLKENHNGEWKMNQCGKKIHVLSKHLLHRVKIKIAFKMFLRLLTPFLLPLIKEKTCH